MPNTDMKILILIVIFHDFVTEKNQKPSIDYFIQGLYKKVFSNLSHTELLRLPKINQNQLQPGFCLYD